MRKYQETHPWLEFTLDMRPATARLWLSLGEAHSKCEHIAHTPLRPAIAELLHMLYLAKGVSATTAIEGNTLTEAQVLERIKHNLDLPPSQDYLGKEIDNITEACNLIKDRVLGGTAATPTPAQICEYNRIVLKNLHLEDGISAGEFRTVTVGVGPYRAVPPEDCRYLLDRLCTWLAEDFSPPSADYAGAMPILKAVVAHLYFELIHPFGDGNGRTGRLIEFHILLGGGVPTAAAHLLSNHYNLTRQEYYRQLNRVSQSKGDLLPFIEYAVTGFVDGLREQLKWIRYQLFDVTWRNFIHETFRDKAGKVEKRLRDLALAMPIEPIPSAKAADLSPRLAAAYAGKTRKTLTRDLKALEKLGLVENSLGRVRARREIVFAFLPGKAVKKEL